MKGFLCDMRSKNKNATFFLLLSSLVEHLLSNTVILGEGVIHDTIGSVSSPLSPWTKGDAICPQNALCPAICALSRWQNPAGKTSSPFRSSKGFQSDGENLLWPPHHRSLREQPTRGGRVFVLSITGTDTRVTEAGVLMGSVGIWWGVHEFSPSFWDPWLVTTRKLKPQQKLAGNSFVRVFFFHNNRITISLWYHKETTPSAWE